MISRGAGALQARRTRPLGGGTMASRSRLVYCIILYDMRLHYTILYYTILYYTILYYSMV